MLPQIQTAIRRYSRNITIRLQRTTIVDRRASKVEVVINFKGVVQPASPIELKFLLEGERSWEYLSIHTKSDIEINTGDLIEVRGLRYRLIRKNRYDEYGYFSYILVEDYR